LNIKWYFATKLKLFNQNDDFERIFLYFCAKRFSLRVWRVWRVWKVWRVWSWL